MVSDFDNQNLHRNHHHLNSPCFPCPYTRFDYNSVRTPGEYLSGHIKGALNVPHDELERRLGEIPGDISSEIVVYCQSGRRAGIAEKILVEKGYTNIKHLIGHWQNWSARLR